MKRVIRANPPAPFAFTTSIYFVATGRTNEKSLNHAKEKTQ